MTKKQILDFLSNNEINVQSARAAMPAIEIAFDSFVKNFDSVFAYVRYEQYNSFHQLTPQKNMLKMAKNIYQKYLSDQNILQEKMDKHQGIENKISEYFHSHKDDKNLLALYQKLIALSRPWWEMAVYVEDKGAVVFDEVVKKFADARQLAKNQATDIVSILSHPEEMSLFTLERKMFFELCLLIMNDSEAKKALTAKRYEEAFKKKLLAKKTKDYLEYFFWCKTDFYEMKKFDIKDLAEEILLEITKQSKSDIHKKYREIDNNFQTIHKKKHTLLKKLKLSTAEKNDIAYLTEIIYWTDRRKSAMVKDLYYIFYVLLRIAENAGCSYQELAMYRIKEIEDLLAKHKRLSKKTIKERMKGTFITFENGKKATVFGTKDSNELFKVATSPKKHAEIKGVVACRANTKKIRGKVKIMLDPNDIFEKDEILVTNMTRVEFVPLMKIAKAIITDEGGIACHAAIVSRELNKPCIIGTKVSTRILKNGDIIELDMEKGQIIIIKN